MENAKWEFGKKMANGKKRVFSWCSVFKFSVAENYFLLVFVFFGCSVL